MTFTKGPMAYPGTPSQSEHFSFWFNSLFGKPGFGAALALNRYIGPESGD